MKPQTVVIDFGSGKIAAVAGIKMKDGSFAITASCESKYAGFCDGQWIEEDALFDAVKSVITQIESLIRTKVSHIYVGVPGDFTSVVVGQASTFFNKIKKVNKYDVARLHKKANKVEDSGNFTCINDSVISYTIDSATTTIDPLNLKCTKLDAKISYVYVDNYFIASIIRMFNLLKIKSYELVSSNLAQALYLIEPEQRDNYTILVDVGYISTNVMLVKGDGLLFLKSFDVGSGHISADLSQVMKVGYLAAEQIRAKINLNLEFDDTNTYSHGAVLVNARMANQVVAARVEDIGALIIKCFSYCNEEFPSSTQMFLTGGGLTYTKGAVEVLSKYLDNPIRIATLPYIQANKNEYTSTYGVLDLALSK